MSSRTWLSYTYQSRFHLTPLSYEMLEYASGFMSEQCPEGIVAIAANTLRLIHFSPIYLLIFILVTTAFVCFVVFVAIIFAYVFQPKIHKQ